MLAYAAEFHLKQANEKTISFGSHMFCPLSKLPPTSACFIYKLINSVFISSSLQTSYFIKSQHPSFIMASLVLLLSQILRHENVENLLSSPPPSSAIAQSSTPPEVLRNRCKSYNQVQLQFQQDLPRVCVDLTWPWIFCISNIALVLL